MWQPIETAPKDGTNVSLWSSGFYGICHWSPPGTISEDGFWCYTPRVEWAILELKSPTHWMPLPEPPSD